MKIFLLSIVLLFSTCKSGQPLDKESPSSVPFQVLISASQSNIEEPQRKIITSQKELEAIFAEINKTRKPGIPIPEIDFNTETVAFVNMGQASTGGHAVTVHNIDKTANTVVIYLDETSPKPGDNATMVITTPFTMVKLKKQNLPIVFNPKMERQ